MLDVSVKFLSENQGVQNYFVDFIKSHRHSPEEYTRNLTSLRSINEREKRQELLKILTEVTSISAQFMAQVAGYKLATLQQMLLMLNIKFLTPKQFFPYSHYKVKKKFLKY
ncbi:MAG: hypothetical protein ACRCXC_06010 [Legionella sp.]